MIVVPVVNVEGQKVGSIEIDPAHFGGDVNKQLLHDAVVMYQANQRVGTHLAKTRGEVIGSGKKLFKQKGTGNARAGSKRTGKRRGGGKAFGPRPRDYSYAMPKKARRLATRMAILGKITSDEAIVLDGLSLNGPKTKEIAGILAKLGVAGESCLITTAAPEQNIYLSARNIPRVETLPAADLNAYAILRRKHLVVTKQALEAIKESAAQCSPTTKE